MALPYVAILTIMTLLVLPYIKKNNKYNVNKCRKFTLSTDFIFVFLAYLIYIFFAVSKSFMPGIGANDAYAYYLNFTMADCSLFNFMTNVTTFEPGFSFIVWIVRQLTTDYRFMILVWHTLTFILIIKFYKLIYLKNHTFLIIFVGLTLLITQFNTLRMSISILVALFSLIAMYEKRWIKSLIIIICAISVHITAVIMLPVFMVIFITYNRKNSKKSVIAILIIFGIVFTISMFGLINKFAINTEKNIYVGYSSVAWGTDAAIIVFLILSYVKFNQIRKMAGINEIFMMALPVELICIPLQLNMAMMYRMILYFIPIIYFLIPSIIQCYKETENKVKYITITIVSYAYLLLQIYSFITEEIVYLNRYIISN